MEEKLEKSEEGQQGLKELNHIMNLTKELGIDNLELNICLARGLDYYTGSIFEVVLNNSAMGSIVGGGRYDDLTEVFGQKKLSGVGISFGAERIYDLMNDLNLFPNNLISPTKYMIINQSDSIINGLKLLKYLRSKNIDSILYPENIKLKKQIKYAHLNKIPYLLFINKEFDEDMSVELKNMDTGTQEESDISTLN